VKIKPRFVQYDEILDKIIFVLSFFFSRTKIIFGTGDHLRAVTMTANRGFVRAAAQQVSS